MSTFWKFTLGIFFLSLIAGGLTVYGYSGLETTLEVEDYSIETDGSVGAIGMAIVDVYLGNVLGAAGELIEGVNAEGNLVFKNPSIVPIYVPHMEHRVYINDRECESVVETDSMWLGPRESKSVPYNILITTDELPEIALNTLAYGGNVDIDMKSELSMGAFTISKKCDDQPEISDPLSSYAKNYSPTPTPLPHPPVSQDSNSAGVRDNTDRFDESDARVRVSITYFESTGSHGDGLEGPNQEAFFSITVNGVKRTSESKGLQDWSLINPFSVVFDVPDDNRPVNVSIAAWEHDYLSGDDQYDIAGKSDYFNYSTTYYVTDGKLTVLTEGRGDGDMKGQMRLTISTVL